MFFNLKLADNQKSRTFASVFFIVLDLRLTKVGVQRYSFFFALTFLINLKRALHSFIPADLHTYLSGF